MVPLDEVTFGRLVNRRNTGDDVNLPNAEGKLTDESRNAHENRFLPVNKITKEEEDYLQGNSIYSQQPKISPRNSQGEVDESAIRSIVKQFDGDEIAVLLSQVEQELV